MPLASAGTTSPRLDSADGRVPAEAPVDLLRYATFRRWVWGAVLVNVPGGAMVFVFLYFAAPMLLSPDAMDRLLLRSGTALAAFAFVVVPVLIRVRRNR